MEMEPIIARISPTSTVLIAERPYKPVAKAIYVTESKPEQWYAKVFFPGHMVLVMSPSDNFVYFGEDVGSVGGQVPCPPELTHKDRLYRLVAEDYQIVTKLEFGSPVHTEGEVRFWDYVCVADESYMLSLGVVQRTGARADVVARVLSLDDLSVQP